MKALAAVLLAVTMVGCSSQATPSAYNDPLHPAAFRRADAESQRGYNQCLDTARMKFDRPVPQDDREYRDRQWREANMDCQLTWLPITFDECVALYSGGIPEMMEGSRKACVSYPKNR